MTSHHRSVLPPHLTPKCVALGTRPGRSNRELEDVLADLSALPPNLVVRASREIAIAARLGWWKPQKLPLRVVVASRARLGWWWPKKPPWLVWPFSRDPSEQELLKKNHDYAWLFLFHPSG